MPNDNTPSSAPLPKGTTLLKKSVSLAHHIFEETYGWIVKESRQQPSIKLKLLTNKFDYGYLNIPCPRITPVKVSAISDTGSQSSLMALKIIRACGFKESSFLLVKEKMFAANNESINILGPVFVRFSGADTKGDAIQTVEMIYASDSTDLFYLSRHTMEQLKIIAPDFPNFGAIASVSDCATTSEATSSF